MFRDTRRMFPAVVLACFAVLLIAFPVFAQSASSVRTLPDTRILGAEDQAKQIAVTFWLNQHDKAGFDDLVRQMYDRNSPNYHHWLTLKEYKARFAPTAADLAVVRQHLAAHNLHVVASDKLNHYVTARGTVADVQRATGVQLNRVSMNGAGSSPARLRARHPRCRRQAGLRRPGTRRFELSELFGAAIRSRYRQTFADVPAGPRRSGSAIL